MPGTGTSIGSYRIIRKLGEGGMGAVYLGEHKLLGRRAAIKVLLPSLSANDDIVKRFFNEARAVTRIADPGIVQVFDFGQHKNGSAFIVMELLIGEPMDRRLRRIGRFGLRECLRLMRQICTSLGVVHTKGIVHRDLKPENLFIVSDPAVPGGERAKILDFGIAKLSGDEPGTYKTRTGVVMGTPAYMSPEQCSGGGEVDLRSDIYAMGCVMFAMLTGKPVFDGKGAGDVIAAHLREPPPRASTRVPELAGDIDELLEKCLQKSPAERFRSMADLVRTLAAAEQALPGESPAREANAAVADAPPGALQLPQILLTTRPGRGGPVPVPDAPASSSSASAALAPSPTTLNNASGQADTPMLVRGPRRRRRQRQVARVLAGALVVVSGLMFLALHGNASPGAGSAAIAGHDVPRIHAEPAVLETIPPPTEQRVSAANPEPAGVTAAPDAGVSDAPAPARAPDSAAQKPHPPRPDRNGARPPRTGGSDDSSTDATQDSIDRGD
jgi:serine/threonine protein kinase